MQKKLIVISLFVLLFSLFPSNANAQTATDAASRLKEQIRLLKDQKQTAASKNKKEPRIEFRQQIKDAVAAKRLEVRATVEAKREEFKAKLQAIRGQKKKALVERIDTKLSNVNMKHTDRFTQVLSNLQMLLNKITQSATDKDILANVANAQAAVDTAKLAVENQAAKTYIITISTETALRSDVGAVTSQLRQDLMATHRLVVDAKQLVQALRKNSAIMKKEAVHLIYK